MSNKTYDKIKNIIKENFKDIIIFVITILIATYQFPYYIESTGGLLETTDRVKIENSYKQKGSFNMAYVNEMPATIPLMLVALINKNWDIVKEEDVKMTTETIDEAMTRSKLYLDISLDNALLYAYTEAGKEVEVNNYNTVLMYKMETSKTDMVIGDQIKKINNVDVNSLDDIQNEVEKYKSKDKISIDVINNNKEYSRYAILNEEGKIGVVLQTTFDIKTNPECIFNFGKKESGPSGGLMTTLTIYNYLIKEDITNGMKIAGTGTIEGDGTVGEIGGIKYKLAGVEKQKADLFFVPAGENYEECAKGIRHVTIPGRMEALPSKNHGTVIDDYAHNKASMMALMSFMQREFNNPKIIVVVGAPGDKGVSRRPGFSESLTAYADKAFLTTDDPGFEDPMDIAQEIDAGIDHEKVDVTIELDREKAIHDAIAMSDKDDIVLICGKGADPYQKIRGVDTPYPTDIKVAESVINELEKDDEE